MLIESKSVTDAIEVNRQLEFVRTHARRRTGMKSPITQVEMQKQILQLKLNDHKTTLRRKMIMDMVQAFFSDDRFKTFVAISDQGKINRRGCNPPQLVKADRVASEIQQIFNRHARASGCGGIMRRLGCRGGRCQRLSRPAFLPKSRWQRAPRYDHAPRYDRTNKKRRSAGTSPAKRQRSFRIHW